MLICRGWPGGPVIQLPHLPHHHERPTATCPPLDQNTIPRVISHSNSTPTLISKQPLHPSHPRSSSSSTTSTPPVKSTMGHGNSFDIGSTIAQIQEKLPSWFPFSDPPTYRYVSHTTPRQLVDFGKPSLWFAVGMIFFNPIFWNFVARNGMSCLISPGNLT